MKKLVSVIALVAMFGVHAGAQSFSTISNLVSSLAGTVYSAPVSLNGTYNYGGIAVSATSSEGGLLTNLAGSAATSALENKADEYLSKVGIKPGAMQFNFNSSDNTFTLNVAGISLPGTYKVGDGEKTVTLTFGKKMQYLCLTGSLESSLSGARMVFPVNKATAFIKKLASVIGQSSSSVGSLAKLAEGYDNYRLGFKMSK